MTLFGGRSRLDRGEQRAPLRHHHVDEVACMTKKKIFKKSCFSACRKIVSLTFLVISAAHASAPTDVSVGASTPAAHSDSAFVDPNGLELDGPGAVAPGVDMQVSDVLLLMTWSAMVFGLAGVLLLERSASDAGEYRRASQASLRSRYRNE